MESKLDSDAHNDTTEDFDDGQSNDKDEIPSSLISCYPCGPSLPQINTFRGEPMNGTQRKVHEECIACTVVWQKS